MPSTLLGDRKVGRPICEDGAYARKMGVRPRLIKSLGGAQYLKSLPECVRNVILRPAIVKLDCKGLTARGMAPRAPIPRNFRPRVEEWDVPKEKVFNEMLRGMQ